MDDGFELSSWLEALGLGQYEARFREEELASYPAIVVLTDAQLKELGMYKMGHRNILLAAAANAPHLPPPAYDPSLLASSSSSSSSRPGPAPAFPAFSAFPALQAPQANNFPSPNPSPGTRPPPFSPSAPSLDEAPEPPKQKNLEAASVPNLTSAARPDPDPLPPPVPPTSTSGNCFIGNRVEALYSNGLRYPGVITAALSCKYSVLYVDGDRSSGLDEICIRLPLQVGERVQAMYANGKWYSGRVSGVPTIGKYNIDYDDGDKSKDLDLNYVRRPFQVGDRVEALSSNCSMGKWYLGCITSCDGNTYRVDYDGPHSAYSNTHCLDLDSVRASVVPKVTTTVFQVGERIEAMYSNGKIYTGAITAITDKQMGKYNVHYDDGDRSNDLDYTKIRKPFRPGDKVQALFSNGKWYPGKISSVPVVGSYNVDYDDGDKGVGLDPNRVLPR